jgi:hypothetical protein
MFTPHRYVSAILLTAGLAIAAPACTTGYYGYQRGGLYPDAERRAYDNGYRDGQKDGEKDARNGRSFSYDRHDDWRDADDGYHRDYGSRDYYRRVFRRGFETGYSEGFNRYARGGYGHPSRRTPYPYPYPSGGYGYPSGGYGYPGAYGSPAAQVGYRDGYEVGRDDARDRESYDPIRSGRYRSADHEYDRNYGSKDDYKRIYRDAFQRGYEAGYREYRRY